jgi:hypothetical protein
MQTVEINAPIRAKAKELKVSPKFLLYSLACAIENRSLDECLTYYFRDLSQVAREVAERQLLSKRENTRKTGQYALSEIDEDALNAYIKSQQNNVKFSVDRYIESHRPIRRYHLAVLESIFKEVMQILKISNKNNLFDQDDTFGGFFPALKFACKNELASLRNFAKLFEGRDLTLN